MRRDYVRLEADALAVRIRQMVENGELRLTQLIDAQPPQSKILHSASRDLAVAEKKKKKKKNSLSLSLSSITSMNLASFAASSAGSSPASSSGLMAG